MELPYLKAFSRFCEVKYQGFVLDYHISNRLLQAIWIHQYPVDRTINKRKSAVRCS